MTSIFMAASSLQLASNWLAAAWFLRPMEVSWGLLRFVLVYALAGAIGTFAGTVHTATVTTGSSCAVFGIVGGYLTVVGIYWTRMGFAMKRQFLLHLIMMPMTYLVLSFLPGVDWVGNLAALGAGAAIAAAMFADRADGWRWKVGFRSAAAVLGLVIVVTALYGMTLHGYECEMPSE
jgi:membrane associated rhomboid family serine protease